MPLWLLVLNPSQGLSPWLSTFMFILPLLLPLKGILAGNHIPLLGQTLY